MMTSSVISEKQLLDCLKGLSTQNKVFAPKNNGEYYLFEEWDGQSLPGDDYENTLKPLKDLFFPQYETLVKYQKAKGERPVISDQDIDDRKCVVFGVRPCDAASLEMLDYVFIGDNYKDLYYKARRENTVIIGLACKEHFEGCFCKDPASKRGLDVLLFKDGDKYSVTAVSERGKELLDASFDTQFELQPCDANAYEQVVEKEIPEKLFKMFEHPIWDEIQQKCLNCGVCTFLCPTCYCFDITDNRRGEIVRNWDSCMFCSFTKQGSGHNPRPTGLERVRQRVMHKYRYFFENYSEIACVGCGRCVTECPVNFDIRQIIEMIRGADVSE